MRSCVFKCTHDKLNDYASNSQIEREGGVEKRARKQAKKPREGNEEMEKVRNVVENCTCRDNKEREKH